MDVEVQGILWYNDCVAVIIVGSRGKKHEVSLRSLLYGIMTDNRIGFGGDFYAEAKNV